VIALFLLLVSSVAAQDYRGKVQGSVTDEARASVPGAQVVLRNTQSGLSIRSSNPAKRSAPYIPKTSNIRPASGTTWRWFTTVSPCVASLTGNVLFVHSIALRRKLNLLARKPGLKRPAKFTSTLRVDFFTVAFLAKQRGADAA